MMVHILYSRFIERHGRKQLRKTLLTTFLIILAVVFPAVGAEAHALHAPAQMGMEARGNGVFLDPDLPAAVREKIPGFIEEAKKLVSYYYRDLLAKPNLVFCGSAACFSNFGGCGLGFTDGEHIVISRQGIRPDIIAHELAHVEFATRLGGFSRVLERVPQWFDEGLAVLVSKSEEFSDDAWLKSTHNGKDAPGLSDLESMQNWSKFTGDQGENRQLTYGTAKREVERWFMIVGSAGLWELIESLKHNESFLHAYRRIEDQPY